MTTTELIELLKKHEHGGASGRPREVMICVGDEIYDINITGISTGDGLFAELFLDIDAQPERKTEPPSAESEKRTEEHTETHSCDLISRQDAIDAVIEAVADWDGGYNITRASVIEKAINDLPSAEPERKTGHWIEHDDGRVYCECSVCHEEYLLYEEHVLGRNYCPNCGARMEMEHE